MTAPLPPGSVRPVAHWHDDEAGLSCGTCNDRIDRHLADIAAAPDPAATAEQTVADLLALCAVFEEKPIAYQWIRPSVIRSIIESGGAE